VLFRSGFSRAPWSSRPVYLCRFAVRIPQHQRLEAFLGSMASADSLCPKTPRPVASRACMHDGFSCRAPYRLRLPNPTDSRPSLLRHSITPLRKYRNINLLSIDYAFRPRLRIRLTLGGRTCPRKPWTYGGRDSHPPFRYSCLHSHLSVPSRSVTLPLVSDRQRSPTTRAAEPFTSPRLRFRT